ncbi:hypothetical protein Tco_0073633 [Tanacetum coccineum]
MEQVWRIDQDLMMKSSVVHSASFRWGSVDRSGRKEATDPTKDPKSHNHEHKLGKVIHPLGIIQSHATSRSLSGVGPSTEDHFNHTFLVDDAGFIDDDEYNVTHVLSSDYDSEDLDSDNEHIVTYCSNMATVVAKGHGGDNGPLDSDRPWENTSGCKNDKARKKTYFDMVTYFSGPDGVRIRKGVEAIFKERYKERRNSVMRLSLDFNKKFYNSLGRAPNRCSVVRQDSGVDIVL